MLGYIRQLAGSPELVGALEGDSFLETLVLYSTEMSPGPNWEAGKSAQDQSGYTGHYEYWMEQHKAGNLFVATAFFNCDCSAGIFSPQVKSFEAATAIMKADPWYELGILVNVVQECSVMPDCSTLG